MGCQLAKVKIKLMLFAPDIEIDSYIDICRTNIACGVKWEFRNLNIEKTRIFTREMDQALDGVLTHKQGCFHCLGTDF